MITVHKFPLQLDDLQTVDLPAGAVVLTVQVQYEALALWARVDTDQPTERRLIRLVGTGNPIPPGTGAYLGTVQMHGGRLVLHAFEG